MTNPDTPPGEIWTMDDLPNAETGDYLPRQYLLTILQEMARRIVALEARLAELTETGEVTDGL